MSHHKQASESCFFAVEEDTGQGQDHIFVVFSLPIASSPTHRSRTLHSGPWGADVAAKGLMGLVGHAYVQKGAVLL